MYYLIYTPFALHAFWSIKSCFIALNNGLTLTRSYLVTSLPV